MSQSERHNDDNFEIMKYFAYGSNLYVKEIRKWVPSATLCCLAVLKHHQLKFHKIGSRDGSGKCDAFKTGNENDVVHGVVYEIDEKEKRSLDRKEGLGYGYNQMEVVLESNKGTVTAFVYVADNEHIDASLKPYSWYKQLVLEGARQQGLPETYIEETIVPVEATEDPDQERDREKRRS